VILQNPIDEQGATSIDRLWKGATNHESLRTTGLVFYFLEFTLFNLKLLCMRIGVNRMGNSYVFIAWHEVIPVHGKNFGSSEKLCYCPYPRDLGFKCDVGPPAGSFARAW